MFEALAILMVIRLGIARIGGASSDGLRYREIKSAVKGFAIVFAAFTLGAVTLVDTPWVPPEIVQRNGTQLVAYVLERDSEWTSVLTEKDRRIVRLRSDQIESRTVCQADPGDHTETIAGRLLHWTSVGYAPCKGP